MQYYKMHSSVEAFINQHRTELSAPNGLFNDDLQSFLDYSTQLQNHNRVITDQLKFLASSLASSNRGIRRNLDYKSLTFFTRPQLNFSSRLLLNDRKLSALLSSKPNSILRYIRLMLDPRLSAIGDDGDVLLESDLIDNNQAFIPFLTNTYQSMSTWPDSVAGIYQSKPGRKKEEFAMIDSSISIYNKFDLDVNFHNMEEEPIGHLFEKWLNYASLQYEGKIYPYYDMIRANEIDYMTRIYKLILTPDGKYVKKIATTGASFPVAITDGAQFNDNEKASPFERVEDNYTVRFTSLGAIYNDPVSLLNFNMVVGYFHPGMMMLNRGESGHGMLKVDTHHMGFLFRQRYPHINLDTLELEWYIDRGVFEENVYSHMGYDTV